MGDAVAGNIASLALSIVAFEIAVASTDTDYDDISLAMVALLQVPLWVGLLGAPLRASFQKGLRSLRDEFGLAMRPRDIWVGLLAGFAGQIAIGIVVVLLYRALGVDTERVGEAAEELADRATSGLDVVLLVLIVVVGAPIVEELFYRGLWLRAIEKRTGSRAVAVVGSSVLFGLIHFQLYDLLALTLAGLLFAWLAVRAGRLGPAIWAHVAFNLTAVLQLL